MRGKREAGLVGLQVSVHDKKPCRHSEKGQRHIFETGIRKCSGLKLAEHGQRDTEGLGNQGSMVVVEGAWRDKFPTHSRKERSQTAPRR